jgi:hypothetical protein
MIHGEQRLDGLDAQALPKALTPLWGGGFATKRGHALPTTGAVTAGRYQPREQRAGVWRPG